MLEYMFFFPFQNDIQMILLNLTIKQLSLDLLSNSLVFIQLHDIFMLLIFTANQLNMVADGRHREKT